jgi:hypothetical protein
MQVSFSNQVLEIVRLVSLNIVLFWFDSQSEDKRTASNREKREFMELILLKVDLQREEEESMETLMYNLL